MRKKVIFVFLVLLAAGLTYGLVETALELINMPPPQPKTISIKIPSIGADIELTKNVVPGTFKYLKSVDELIEVAERIGIKPVIAIPSQDEFTEPLVANGLGITYWLYDARRGAHYYAVRGFSHDELVFRGPYSRGKIIFEQNTFTIAPRRSTGFHWFIIAISSLLVVGIVAYLVSKHQPPPAKKNKGPSPA